MRSAAFRIPFSPGADLSATPNFNRIARIYRWMEWLTFGPFLQRCRCAFLTSLAQRRRALILGDGDGRFTARLLQANPVIEVDAVDASEKMLRQLASRSPVPRIRTHVADARTFSPPRSDYDLIASHFFLDCFSETEIRAISARVNNHTRAEAVWIISEFAVPPNLYGRMVARPLVTALYFVFAWLTRLRVRRLPDHHRALADSGWSLQHRHKRLGGLLVSEIWMRSPFI